MCSPLLLPPKVFTVDQEEKDYRRVEKEKLSFIIFNKDIRVFSRKLMLNPKAIPLKSPWIQGDFLQKRILENIS